MSNSIKFFLIIVLSSAVAFSFIVVFKKDNRSVQVYHYSSLEAFRNGVFNGDKNINDIKTKGSFGLGTYDYLHGELVGDGNKIYQILPDGKAIEAKNDFKVAYASVTDFQTKESIHKNIKNAPELQGYILSILPSLNKPYAIKIEAKFDSILLGSSTKVDSNDHRALNEILINRPKHLKTNVEGMMVGFYTPDYLSRIEVANFHFHFITNDKQFGGHVLSFKSMNGKIFIDKKDFYEIELTKHNVEYNRKWKEEETTKGY